MAMRLLRVTPIALLATFALLGTAAAVGATLHAQHAATTAKGSLAGDQNANADTKGVSWGTSLTTDKASVKGAADVAPPAMPAVPNVHSLPTASDLSAPDAKGGADGSGGVETDHGSASGAGGLKIG